MHDACVQPLLAVDFIEHDDDFKVFVDLPGVEMVDLGVWLDYKSATLHIKAERKRPSAANSKGIYDELPSYSDQMDTPNERVYGKVERAIPLPMNIDEDSGSAYFEHGVLSITFNKKVLKVQKVRVDRR
jgi:HSP20 family protein